MNRGLEEPALIPIETELQDRVTSFIRLRWVAGFGILAGIWADRFLFGFSLPVLPISLIGASVLLYNLLFHFWGSRLQSGPTILKNFILLQIEMDWLALLSLAYYSGGIRGPVPIAFIFHLIISAILLSRRSCYILTAFACLLLGILAGIEHAPSNDRLDLFAGLPIGRSEWHLWLIFTGFFFITTYLTTSITGKLREKEISLARSERALDQAYHEMEALYQLGQLVNSTLDMKEVLQIIADNAVRLLKKKACFIRLLDASEKQLYIGASSGFSKAYVDKGPVEVNRSKIDAEALAGGTVQVLEVGDDYRFQYREEARREGLRSMLCVPMLAKSRVLGVIRVYTDEPHVFSELEVSLLRNLANLGAVAIQNARSYAELETLTEQRIWFARMTHHQLRAPLAAIQGTLEALPYAGGLNQRQQDLVERAERRLQDSFDTIRDLLDLAAAQRAVDSEERVEVALQDALERVLETVREQAKDKRIVFTETFSESPLDVVLPASDLQRIVLNLLDNAIKYTPPEGRVAFSASTRNAALVIEVSDNGIGIEPELQDRIFDGFFRTPAAKATGAMGTGLGLSIVKKLVERLEGSIEFDSRPGRGTRVQVAIPRKLE